MLLHRTQLDCTCDESYAHVSKATRCAIIDEKNGTQSLRELRRIPTKQQTFVDLEFLLS